MLSIKCGVCGLRLKAQENAAGRTVQCPKCSTPITLPSVASTSQENASVQRPLWQSLYVKYYDWVGLVLPPVVSAVFFLVYFGGGQQEGISKCGSIVGAIAGPAMGVRLFTMIGNELLKNHVRSEIVPYVSGTVVGFGGFALACFTMGIPMALIYIPWVFVWLGADAFALHLGKRF